MRVLSGLVASGLLACASANQSVPQLNGDHQVGKVFEHEYVQPNVEEICFSTRPVAKCDEQHVASYVKHQKVGFYCLSKNNPTTKQYQRESDQGRQLALENKTQDIQAYVEVPTRCERINTEERRLRKQAEKTAEQKIHIVQNQDEEEESFLFEHKPWTGALEQEQDIEQDRQHGQSSSLTRKSHQYKLRDSVNAWKVSDLDDEDQVEEENLDTMEQFSQLINKQTSMHRILKMNDEQFDRLMEHLKFIAHQSRHSDKWSQQFDQILPNVFSKVATDFFETVLEQQTNSQQEKEELYEQYKEVVHRVYAYVLKQVLKMKQLNQITGQNEQVNKQHLKRFTNKIVNNLWYKIQKELTQSQVEEVRQISERVQRQKSKLNRMLAEETVVASNKQQMQQLEENLTKVLTAGLKMVNHNIAKNQIDSDEYRQFHGEDFETSFKSQYPKLHSRLQTIQNYNQWSN